MTLRIGQLARRTGLKTSALRYYEAEGLLGPTQRSEAGYRLYEPRALGQVEFIQRAKSLGLPLAQIRRLVELPRSDPGAQREALRHLVAHTLADTRRRMGELEALSRELEALHVRLQRVRVPDCGHVGDCACWLPTEEEAKRMSDELSATDACTCCEPGCDSDCACCGDAGISGG